MAALGPQLIALAELAHVDAKAKALRDRLEHLPADARKADELHKKLVADVATVGLRKSTSESAKRTAEHEITEERQKVRKWEARANDVRGDREHAALTSEIGTAKRTMRRLEDDVLEHMEALEAADKDLANLQKKLDAAANNAKAEWAKVDADMTSTKAELAGIEAGRSAVLQKLPDALAKRYDTIAQRRAGLGVGIIDAQDRCGGCQRSVPPQLSIQVQKGLVLEACPACSRLLVHHTMTNTEVNRGQ
jgi:uncharacterized protein